MSNLDLSVIISTYNRTEQLSLALKDFEEQVFPDGKFSWELIIVDNNSKDNTRELVQKWIEKKTLPIVYEFESTQGKSYALNRALNIVRSEQIAFTDDDVRIDSLWLQTIYNAFKNHDCNCFGGKIVPVFESDLPEWLTSDSRYPTHLSAIGNHDLGDKVRDYRRRRHGPSGANMFMRRELFRKYGYFKTEMGYWGTVDRIFGEDTEITYRFRKNGEKILYIPEAVVYHPAPLEKLQKSYIRMYTWASARGDSRWIDIPSGAIRYFNVPRYLIREAIMQFFIFLFSRLSRKEYKKFYYEIQSLYKLGIVYDFYMRGK